MRSWSRVLPPTLGPNATGAYVRSHWQHVYRETCESRGLCKHSESCVMCICRDCGKNLGIYLPAECHLLAHSPSSVPLGSFRPSRTTRLVSWLGLTGPRILHLFHFVHPISCQCSISLLSLRPILQSFQRWMCVSGFSDNYVPGKAETIDLELIGSGNLVASFFSGSSASVEKLRFSCSPAYPASALLPWEPLLNTPDDFPSVNFFSHFLCLFSFHKLYSILITGRANSRCRL
jgi:hypothetical protein